jgi:hypothetical protein
VLAKAAPLCGLAAQSEWSVAPLRLQPGQTIAIDGALDDDAWSVAPALGELGMVEPVEGTPGKPTRVLLCYDEKFFYVALVCAEDPGRVHGRLMARDARLDPDDRVELWFDTFGGRRFGYWFQIGAGGSLGDALISDHGFGFNKSWDAIWYGKARTTPQGWQAELAIPFQTLGFRPGLTTWGFNLRRLRKVNDEEHRWAYPTNAHRFFSLANGGELTGMTGMRQGLGIDVVPFAKARFTSDRTAVDHVSRSGDAGGDVFYRVTPALRLALTYNTDFAETEVDARQVNLTRFPLFFPEKRDFFLEDATVFEFGIPSSPDDGDAVRPFFSRRIGLRGGAPVPIIGGAKLTGQVGAVNLGLLDVVVDDPVVGEQNLGVARASYDLADECAVGVVGTLGHPTEEANAATAGADVALGDSELFGDGRGGHLWLYWLGTTREGAGGDGGAAGAEARYTSSDWEHAFHASTLSPQFEPALGFVRRAGINTYRWETDLARRSPEGSFLRRYDASVAATYVTDTGGGRDTAELEVQPIGLVFGDDDSIAYQISREFERIPERFELRSGVGVAPGDYDSTSHGLAISTAERRSLAVRADLQLGEFYSGHLFRWAVAPTAYLSKFVQLSGEYEEIEVRVDEGRFTARLWQGRVDVAFSPEVSWRNLVQFDNESRDLTVQSRLHWILEPGQDLFLLAVYGWRQDDRAGPLRPAEQDTSVKFVYTFRF